MVNYPDEIEGQQPNQNQYYPGIHDKKDNSLIFVLIGITFVSLIVFYYISTQGFFKSDVSLECKENFTCPKIPEIPKCPLCPSLTCGNITNNITNNIILIHNNTNLSRYNMNISVNITNST